MGTDFGASLPSSYIRPELESQEVLVDESLQVPVIDMSKLVVVDDQFIVHDDELLKFHLACKHWGCFQLINHGISEEVIEKMKIDTADFFKLPLEEKIAYAQKPNNIEGYSKAFISCQEQKVDRGDLFFLHTQPISLRNTTLWPTNPASFRATLDKYSSELQKVLTCLLKLMAKDLGIESEKLTSLFEGGTQGIRMNYYLPCVVADKIVGLTKHTDASGLTLLIQANEVQGLQFKKDGNWVPIKPIPGAFIINLGDIIEIMSNGEYKSVEHRAVLIPEKERVSIAAFNGPNRKSIVGPLPELVKDKAIYKSVEREEFMELVAASRREGKNQLSLMKLEL